MKYEDLKDFIKYYNPENRRDRKETEKFKVFTYGELMKRDNVNLDIFWLRDESFEDFENLPDPSVLGREIMEDLKAVLDQFSDLYEDLEEKE